MTHIYHIAYAPAAKEVTVFFWGCNFHCRGCLCQKEIHNYLLKENLHLFFDDSSTMAAPPKRFLGFDEVIDTLKKIDFHSIYLEGQEPSIDPEYPRLTAALHEKFGCRIQLLTNGYKLTDLSHTDKVAFGFKAISEPLHRAYTGKSNAPALKNFVKIYSSGIELMATSVLIPGYIDSEEIEKIAAFVAGVDREIPFVILPFLKAGKNDWRRPTSLEMERAAEAARRHLKTVYGWSGGETLQYELIQVV